MMDMCSDNAAVKMKSVIPAMEADLAGGGFAGALVKALAAEYGGTVEMQGDGCVCVAGVLHSVEPHGVWSGTTHTRSKRW